MADADKGTAGRRPRRERNPEETKRRILDAAEAEFATKGFDGARLREVAGFAGVHHALLHHYFGDKQGLFRAVLERALDSLSTKGLELLRTTPDVRQLLERYVDVVVDYYAENRHLLQILHFAHLDRGSPAYAMSEEVAQSLLGPLVEATVQTVERARDAGSIRADVDAPRVVAFALGAAAYIFHEETFFSAWLSRDIRAPDFLAEHKRATVKLLLDGLMAPDA